MGTKTFLQYANDLLVPFGETQIASSDWASLTGPQLAAKKAVIWAVDEIMSRERKWPFNRQEGEQVLTIGTVEYAWPSGYREVDMKSFYIEKDDSLNINTTKLTSIDQEEWYRHHRETDLDNTTAGRRIPDYVFRTSGKFGVTPSPDKAYTVKFTYFSIPTRMSAYDDTTTIPDEYEHVVISHAQVWMNFFYENDEQMNLARERAKEYLKDMRSILINNDDDFHMKDTRVPNVG